MKVYILRQDVGGADDFSLWKTLGVFTTEEGAKDFVSTRGGYGYQIEEIDLVEGEENAKR